MIYLHDSNDRMVSSFWEGLSQQGIEKKIFLRISKFTVTGMYPLDKQPPNLPIK